MRVFLAVSAKRRGELAVRQAAERARRAVRAAFPVPWESVSGREWHAPHGEVVLLAWSNEPVTGDGSGLLDPRGGGVEGISGYLTGSGEGGNGSGGSGGGGCAAVFRADPAGMSAATGLAPANPVFYAETPELHIVGSRALLVHLTASGSAAVEWDVLALQSMVRQGYFLSDETPFRGVRALPPAATLVVEDGRRRITSTALQRGSGRDAGEVAAALVSALAPLRAADEPVRLSLTGGRDSRLIAAMLHAAAIPFQAITYGRDTDPDVVLGRKVAARLGVEHRVVPPAGAGAVGGTGAVGGAGAGARAGVVGEVGRARFPHPLERVREVIGGCEGMTSAYENVVPYAPFTRRPTMGGQSGEILRGGYLAGMSSIMPKAVERKLDTLFLAHAELFTPQANEHAIALAEPWRGRDPAILDHLYVHYRVGRWHAAARTGQLRRGTQVQPFLDERVVGAALALDPSWRWSERLVHGLIEELVPGLAAIPLQGRPWRFTAGPAQPKRTAGHPPAGRPGRLARLRARLLRTPTVPPAVPPAVPSTMSPAVSPAVSPVARTPDWRAEPGAELVDVLRSAVLGSAGLAGIVDLDVAAELFDGDRLRRPGLAWNLYTVASLLDQGLAAPLAPVAEPVLLPR